MITEITSTTEYDKIYKRIKSIINTLNKYNARGNIMCYSNLSKKLYIHKNSLSYDNPLQILVAEGLYKMKLIFKYQKQSLCI